MSWWQYLLIFPAAAIGAMLMAGAMIVLSYMATFIIWKFMPSGFVKNFLFKERGGVPTEPPVFIPPWVKARWLKTPVPANRIAPPPEFISAEEFKAKTPGDRR